jgi:hypothetical protein
LRVHRSKRPGRFDVRADGKGLTGRSGTGALRELADRLGLTDALSVAAGPSCPAGLGHDPGAVLRDLVVTLADGGDDFSAIEVLRGQADLMGAVASDSTAWRRVADLAGDELAIARLDTARAAGRAAAWAAGGAPVAVTDPGSGPLCVDIDATLVTAEVLLSLLTIPAGKLPATGGSLVHLPVWLLWRQWARRAALAAASPSARCLRIMPPRPRCSSSGVTYPIPAWSRTVL